MSVFDGQRIVSKRRRMLAYCEKHGVTVPSAFHDLNTIYPIAVIDLSKPQKPCLLPTTFYNASTVLTYLRDTDKSPESCKVLDFERGYEYLLTPNVTYERGPKFDNCKNVDTVR